MVETKLPGKCRNVMKIGSQCVRCKLIFTFVDWFSTHVEPHGIAYDMVYEQLNSLTGWRRWSFYWAHFGNVSARKMMTKPWIQFLFYFYPPSPPFSVLRFGKCIDLLHAARKSIHHRNFTLRLTLTLSKIAQALYLYADHILWLSRAGVVKSFDAKRWNVSANKYWLASIVINLCRDMYELSKLIDQSVDGGRGGGDSITKRFSNISLRSKNDLQRASQQMYSYVQTNRAVFIDTTKNLCDLFIPLTALGYTRLKPRTIGMLGVISSIAGILVLLEPATKLVPS